MEKETSEMMEILHKNHKVENLKYNTEKAINENRKRISQIKQQKEEISKNRAMTMLIISLVLLVFKIYGIV